jgi:hypothetical protein
MNVVDDILPILLAKPYKNTPGKSRRWLKTNMRSCARVLNKRWDQWNSRCINMTHNEMVNHLYPRDRSLYR